MKKSGMFALLGIVMIFIGVSIKIQPSSGRVISNQSKELIDSTKSEYKKFANISYNVEEILNSFEGLFGIYLEEVPSVYQEYFDKLDLVKVELTKLEDSVKALNELCNIPFDDIETTNICSNYVENHKKIRESYQDVVKTFNETVTNYNNLAMYSDILEEKQLYN